MEIISGEADILEGSRMAFGMRDGEICDGEGDV